MYLKMSSAEYRLLYSVFSALNFSLDPKNEMMYVSGPSNKLSYPWMGFLEKSINTSTTCRWLSEDCCSSSGSFY